MFKVMCHLTIILSEYNLCLEIIFLDPCGVAVHRIQLAITAMVLSIISTIFSSMTTGALCIINGNYEKEHEKQPNSLILTKYHTERKGHTNKSKKRKEIVRFTI